MIIDMECIDDTSEIIKQIKTDLVAELEICSHSCTVTEQSVLLYELSKIYKGPNKDKYIQIFKNTFYEKMNGTQTNITPYHLIAHKPIDATNIERNIHCNILQWITSLLEKDKYDTWSQIICSTMDKYTKHKFNHVIEREMFKIQWICKDAINICIFKAEFDLQGTFMNMSMRTCYGWVYESRPDFVQQYLNMVMFHSKTQISTINHVNIQPVQKN
jgi:hypothetical protein